jgi:precorrin-6Y C5,15-methyltransferase (decarboxylating)
MITKSEVRALALSRLAPAVGRMVWDIGAGSGSVAVECARFGAAAIAVEVDPLAGDRIRRNALRHGVSVRVVTGAAPAAMAGLPTPDSVFVGGGGAPVVTAVAARRVPRIVVARAALDQALAALAALRDAGDAVDGVQLAASRLAPLPDGAVRLAARNPVTLLWGTRDQQRNEGGHP